MDFSAIEDSWSFDEFRKYSLLRCTAQAFQNEQQSDIANQYYERSDALLAVSSHPASVYFHLSEEAKITANQLNIEQSGQFCMNWVLSKDYEYSIIHKLSSPL